MAPGGVAERGVPLGATQWHGECGWPTSPEADVSKWIKTILLVLVVGFALFYLFTRPEAAASAVKSFFGAFDAIGRFFVALSR